MFGRISRFLYPDFGDGAQPEVKAAMERFRDLPMRVRSKATSAWGWLLGPLGTPPGKIERDWIEWKKRPVQGRGCGNCGRFYLHYVTKTGICDSVQGVWYKSWWCERWTQSMDPETYREYQQPGRHDLQLEQQDDPYQIATIDIDAELRALGIDPRDLEEPW